MNVNHKDLSLGRKLGDGAQGIVYEVASHKGVQFPFPVVYKEFKTNVSISPILLDNLILFRDSLEDKKRAFLDDRTTWPLASVKKAVATSGYLMRRIPGKFFVDFSSPSGQKSTICEIQLLKKSEKTFLADHGFAVTPAERIRLSYELARIYNFLHSHGFIYGDLNWCNALWSLSGGGIVALLDCDGIRKKGNSAPSEQMHSPHWTPPGKKNVQSIETDCYKLALAILRMLSPGLNGQFQGSQESHFQIASVIASDDLIRLLRLALDSNTAREKIPTAGELQKQLKAERPPVHFMAHNISSQIKKRGQFTSYSHGAAQKGGKGAPPPPFPSSKGSTLPPQLPSSTKQPVTTPTAQQKSAAASLSCGGCLLLAGVLFALFMIVTMISSPSKGGAQRSTSKGEFVVQKTESPSNLAPISIRDNASGGASISQPGVTNSSKEEIPNAGRSEMRNSQGIVEMRQDGSSAGSSNSAAPSGGGASPSARRTEGVQFLPIINRNGDVMSANIVGVGVRNLIAQDRSGDYFIIPVQSLSDGTRLAYFFRSGESPKIEGLIRRNVKLKEGESFRPWFLEFRGKRPFAGEEHLTVRLEVIHLNGDITVSYGGKEVYVLQSLLSQETRDRLDEYRLMIRETSG